ncbi:hypothetical protein PG984_010187 [Apiospora sp. TS-2023a]
MMKSPIAHYLPWHCGLPPVIRFILILAPGPKETGQIDDDGGRTLLLPARLPRQRRALPVAPPRVSSSPNGRNRE